MKTAELIVEEFKSTKNLEEMRTDLRDLWDNFVIHNDTTSAEDRGNVFCTYKALDDAIVAIQQMKS
jgi:hypothetical protein